MAAAITSKNSKIRPSLCPKIWLITLNSVRKNLWYMVCKLLPKKYKIISNFHVRKSQHLALHKTSLYTLWRLHVMKLLCLPHKRSWLKSLTITKRTLQRWVPTAPLKKWMMSSHLDLNLVRAHTLLSDLLPRKRQDKHMPPKYMINRNLSTIIVDNQCAVKSCLCKNFFIDIS